MLMAPHRWSQMALDSRSRMCTLKKGTIQEVEMQIINPMFINVAIMVYKGLEDFGDSSESLENNHAMNPQATPSI